MKLFDFANRAVRTALLIVAHRVWVVHCGHARKGNDETVPSIDILNKCFCENSAVERQQNFVAKGELVFS